MSLKFCLSFMKRLFGWNVWCLILMFFVFNSVMFRRELNSLVSILSDWCMWFMMFWCLVLDFVLGRDFINRLIVWSGWCKLWFVWVKNLDLVRLVLLVLVCVVCKVFVWWCKLFSKLFFFICRWKVCNIKLLILWVSVMIIMRK